jgi:hypothetical protein
MNNKYWMAHDKENRRAVLEYRYFTKPYSQKTVFDCSPVYSPIVDMGEMTNNNMKIDGLC